jgi:hypothetical protein
MPTVTKGRCDCDLSRSIIKYQRTAAPFDSRKRASGGDELSGFNSRRRWSLRVTDSPCLRE